MIVGTTRISKHQPHANVGLRTIHCVDNQDFYLEAMAGSTLRGAVSCLSISISTMDHRIIQLAVSSTMIETPLHRSTLEKYFPAGFESPV